MYASINRLFNPKPKTPIKEFQIDQNNSQDRQILIESRLSPPTSCTKLPQTISSYTPSHSPPSHPPPLTQNVSIPDPTVFQDPANLLNILGSYWSLESKNLGPSKIDRKCLNHLQSFPQFSHTPPSSSTSFNDAHTSINPSLAFIPDGLFFSSSELTEVIRSCNSKRSFSFDLIPSIAIKNLPEAIIQELLALFNNILANNHYPSAWRTAKTIPILKKNKPPNKYTSFRPISLLSNVSKIYESLLHKKIQSHIVASNLYPDNQFGFRPAHSTIHATNTLTSHVSHYFNTTPAIPTGALMIDISRAFDSVWIPGLLYQMSKLNFPTRLLHVLWSVLTNKSFIVQSCETLEPSKPFPLANGLQQGSILASTLFNLYITPLLTKPSLNSHKSQILAFADDILIYSSAPKM